MRGSRWLLLVAIVAIIGGVSYTYRAQKQAIKAAAPSNPQALPDDLNFVGEGPHGARSRLTAPAKSTSLKPAVIAS